tara:strand:- start:233 stop:496 length:264 start_codon:yes stop_codon:yes gene_type:complete
MVGLIKVGVKNPKEFNYYYIDDTEYNEFNKKLKSQGFVDYDIGNKFEVTTKEKSMFKSSSYDVDTDKTKSYYLRRNPKYKALFGEDK